jgi:hypothetical protein
MLIRQQCSNEYTETAVEVEFEAVLKKLKNNKAPGECVLN